MQYYDITITPNGMQEQGVSGRYFYYLEGTTALITANNAGAAGNEQILVQAMGTGEAVPLMPGQSFRIDDSDKRPSGWRITNAKRNETITGKILIGDGEFRDSNIKNTVKLDLTSANQVTVQNASLPVTIAQELEVKNDAGNPLNVSVAGTPSVTVSGVATVQENLIAANGIGSHTNKTGSFVTTFVTAAANVNGIIVHAANGSFVTPNQAASVSLIAKNGSSPVNVDDGTTLIAGAAGVSSAGQFALPTKIRLPAGYSLSYVNSGTGSPFALMNAGVAYTLL